MTYPEDVLKAAREVAIGAVNALHWGGLGVPETYRARTESGQNDHSVEVQAAVHAIMAERRRCAGIAKTVMDVHERLYPSARDDGQRDRVGARFRTAKRIYLTILGPESKEGE